MESVTGVSESFFNLRYLLNGTGHHNSTVRVCCVLQTSNLILPDVTLGISCRHTNKFTTVNIRKIQCTMHLYEIVCQSGSGVESVSKESNGTGGQRGGYSGGDFRWRVGGWDFLKTVVGGLEDEHGVERGLEESIKGSKSERSWINGGYLVGAGREEQEQEERNRRGHGPPPSQRQDWDCWWQRKKASRGQEEERVIEGQEGPQGRSA